MGIGQRNGFILKAWKSATSHVNPVHPVTDEHSAAAMIVLVECEGYDEGTKTRCNVVVDT